MSRFANFMKFMSNNRPSDTIIGAIFQTGVIGYAMIQANNNQKISTNLQKKIHDDSTNLQKKIHDDRARFIIDCFNDR